MLLPRPHDLLWITDRSDLQSDTPLPDWVASAWRPALPLVVRRDKRADGAVAVGIRGVNRLQRAAAWVAPASIKHLITPESLVVDVNTLLRSPFVSQQPVQALIALCEQRFPWMWGVTGSCAYALATDIPVMHAESDLDLLIRCSQRVERAEFSDFYSLLQKLPCRADVQINTPAGGFALSEWLSADRVMLKTDTGPLLVDDPWAVMGQCESAL
ncbi:malonate decarboxylase holo-ACP synthase [Rouxiella sp. Mn2063]|uniref:malonate decarboxylase holo-ACP synthase n=1 Tax=Rouxiella sp. Mn2063 TaxID=3395262 RepID=UPI003BBAD786